MRVYLDSCGRLGPAAFVVAMLAAVSLAAIPLAAVSLADEPPAPKLIQLQDLFPPLTEPQCSYCATQHRKRLIDDGDLVLAWIRGAHNGGAIPVRHFLAGPRVINDTYGLFFYDPDGGYVAAYQKDYGYKFYGWRGGTMVVQGRDGTLWSALSGTAFDGPRKGQRLERIPSLTTQWGHWMMLHPESTAYELFDGQKYQITPLPVANSGDSLASRGPVDARLPAETPVLGLEWGGKTIAFPLDDKIDRACFTVPASTTPANTAAAATAAADAGSATVFWYGPTRSAVAFRNAVAGRALTFYADKISPETAPFKDRETGTRWTLAGRGVDGPLKGQELAWTPSIQCRWFAWSAENPRTEIWKAASK